MLTTDAFALRFLGGLIGYESWATTTNIMRGRALNHASKIINGLRFFGEKTSPTQTDAFPRNGETTVPVDVQEACAFLAFELAEGASVEHEAVIADMRSQGYANIRSSHDTETPKIHVLCGVISYAAWLKLVPYVVLPRGVVIERK